MTNIDDWQEYQEQEWDEELPTEVRSRANREDIQELVRRINVLGNIVRGQQRECIRSHEMILGLKQRFERLETTVTTGTNAMTTRVAILEHSEKNIYELREIDRQDLDELRELLILIKSFPFGLKGMVITLILVVFFTTICVKIIVRETDWFPKIIEELVKE